MSEVLDYIMLVAGLGVIGTGAVGYSLLTIKYRQITTEINEKYNTLGLKEVNGHKCPNCNEILEGNKEQAIKHVELETLVK